MSYKTYYIIRRLLLEGLYVRQLACVNRVVPLLKPALRRAEADVGVDAL